VTESSDEKASAPRAVSQAVSMRKTGLDVVGEVAWGSHFCQFYHTREDLLDILVPYFRAGLGSNEFCMWITSDPLSVAQASAALTAAVPDLEQRIAAGQMEILDHRQWYLLDGRFDADRVLQGWVDKLETALGRGFDGLRLSGNTFWLEENLWRGFSEYEAAVDRVIQKYRMLALCTYSLEKCGAFEVVDVVHNHRFALVRRGQRWEILQSTQREAAELALRESEHQYQTLFGTILENMQDGVYIAKQNYEIEYINPVLEREFGPVAGRKCYQYFHDRQEPCPWCKNREILAGHTVRWQWYFPKSEKMYDLIDTPLQQADGSIAKLEIFRDATERQRAERLLEETNRRLTKILDSISDGFFALEGDLVITYFNNAAERLLGRKREEVLGQSYSDAFPEARGSIFHERYAEAMRDRKPLAFETYFGIAPYENWYDVRVYPFENGLGVYFQVTTERKRAEMALQDSEQRLRLTLEGGRMGLWEWDLQSDSSFWDQRMYELLGLEPSQQPKSETFFAHVHPQDKEMLEKLVADMLAGHEDFQAEFRILPGNAGLPGELRWLASRGRVIRDEQGRGARMLGVLYDITQHKRMEAELRRLNDELEEEVQAQTQELRTSIDRLQDEVGRRTVAEERLREHSRMLEVFFQHTITPLAFMDRHFSFIRVNEAYAKADGKSPEYFVGRNHFSLYPDEENEAIFERVAQTGQAYVAYAKPFTYPYAPERGVTYWNWQLTPLLDNSGEVQFLVLNLENVTGRQRAFRELEQRARQLQQLTLQLSQAEDRERKRLAEILHDDLQQQLAAVKFQLGLLSKRAKPDHATGEIAAQLDQMLKDAIEKSRSLSHELSPTVLYQADLSGMFEWLADQLQTKHGLMVRVEIRGAIDLPSESLKAFLFRTAQEILFNVVKHARTGEARLRLQRIRGRLRLSIADKGQGFDPALLGQTAGFGLLSIRERIELLGGRMKIRSAKGKGSVFLIMLPDGRMMETAQSTPESMATRSTGYDKHAEHARDHRLRVLLVDDHKVMREGLAALLNEQQDMDVVGQAGNGREAVDMAYKLEPDVVVMDAAMPVMPGDEATRQIRLHLPRTRVIALSMFAESEMAGRMWQSGAEAYLLKTAPSEKLLAAIRGR
jgi:PAS domain S-box-containing protein